jgi:hypothetical protein
LEDKVKKLLLLSALGAIVVSVMVFSGSPVRASIPHLINYQGMLTNESGDPITDTLDLKFRIYNAETNGDLKWSETQTDVEITDGLFNVILGSENPIDTLSFSKGYWLEVQVDGDTMPRLRFTSVGYAYRAEMADTADYATTGASDNDWTFRITDGADTTLITGGAWGIARYGNTLYGNADSTHVNLGVACTTGTSGASVKYCTVGGGMRNTAGGQYATVGGGQDNTASAGWATVGGGKTNTASGLYTVVGGGKENRVGGDYSAVLGGYADTITGTADYSYLFGIKSKLTADSTFMVDMPHIRFGDESNGYEFPASDGVSGQVMATDGSGQLSWTDVSGAGSNWTVTDSVLYTNNFWGIARGNAGNVLYGDSAHTMVNLGVACTTGTDGLNTNYCAVGGGLGNTASGYAATVGGGEENTASSGATVGGGYWNTAYGNIATVGGGQNNLAYGDRATVGGGHDNLASGDYATVGGGEYNTASNYRATVGGGRDNTASGDYATVGGGRDNTASGYYTTVGGGCYDTASGGAATIGGGENNTASADYATVGGGYNNKATWGRATVGGGQDNTASAGYATIGGGRNNTASGDLATVGGGSYNTASLDWATVGGGVGNTASHAYATVGGGYYNTAYGTYATVCGGWNNVASGNYANVLGGRADTVAGDHSFATGREVRVTGAADYTFAFGRNFTTSTPNAVIFFNSDAEIKVGIDTTSPGNIITVKKNSITDPIADSWSNYSSIRWKENINPIDNALDKVLALRGVYFDWKESKKHDTGMIAEEVGEVIPEVVTYEKNGIDAQSLDYARLTALLVEAIKEQQKEIELLKAKIEVLETGRK